MLSSCAANFHSGDHYVSKIKHTCGYGVGYLGHGKGMIRFIDSHLFSENGVEWGVGIVTECVV